MLSGLRLMTVTPLFVGCAALHFGPTGRVAKPTQPFTRRAAVLVMDEESEVNFVPFTNVTGAVAEIKEVLRQDAEAAAEAAAKAAWLKKAYDGYPSPADQGAATAASPPPLAPELAALTAEKNELDEVLLQGYDAEKVQRLAEVEAMLAEANVAAPQETALSAEEAAKAAWLAKTYGEWPSSAGQGAATAASPPPLAPELAALSAEKNELDEALLQGYDAEKVQRLAEVEAMLAEANVAAPQETALSAEEAAKAAWLAARFRPWGDMGTAM